MNFVQPLQNTLGAFLAFLPVLVGALVILLRPRLVRVLVRMTKKIRKVSHARSALSSKLEREPTEEELARALGWKLDAVREVETTKLLDTVKKHPKRSRYVLARRYGTRRLKQANLDETSEDLAVSSNTVLRIQSNAEHVLRTRLCGRFFRETAA